MLTRRYWIAFGCAVVLGATAGSTAPVTTAHAATPEHEPTVTSAAATERGRPASRADTVPPTKPGLSIAREVSLAWATINVLTPSYDNTGVAGYVVQRQIGGIWTDVATNNISTVYLRDLTPATTYSVVVVAFDSAGNRSPQSDLITFTTRVVESAPTCQVQLVNFNSGYLANVTVENMTLTPLPGWFVTFTLPSSHTVHTTPNASLVRTGEQARLNPSPWFATLGSGVRGTLVVNAAKPVSAPLPSDFRLSGTTGCSATS